MRFRFLTGLILSGCLLSLQVNASEGVTENEVKFAQVAGLEGPFGTIGQEFRIGLQAAFNEANAAGGVYGRQVLLDSFDDSNEPFETVGLIRKIVSKDEHLALIGMSGEQSARVVQEDLKRVQFPFLAPVSGDPYLRSLALAHVRTIRPSIDIEAEFWARRLVDDRGLKRIAVLYQSDIFGRQGHAALAAALSERGIELVAAARYPRNTTAVLVPLLKLQRAHPEAVVLFAETEPATSFLSMAAALDFDPLFLVGSRISPHMLAEGLGGEIEGLEFARVTPPLRAGTDGPPVSFVDALSSYAPEVVPDTLAFEGYIAGRYALAVLEQAGPDLDREQFKKTLRKLRDLEIDGLALSFGPGDTQGSDLVATLEGAIE